MARGRKPKSTAQKLLTGNPGRRRLNDGEPVPVHDITEPPEHFNDDQKNIWRTVLGYAPNAMIKETDRGLMEAYVIAHDNHRQSVIKMNEQAKVMGNSQVIKSGEKGQLQQNPFLSIVNRQAVLINSLGSSLGLNPASRTGIKMDLLADKESFTDFKAAKPDATAKVH